MAKPCSDIILVNPVVCMHID
uniref:Uncharacterized protein n=1 Tax=Arundo donax TaxID=35708 RepID=A0A0A9HNT3_ARUDO